MKMVDILIPTYKPGKELTELLRRLHQQTVDIHKIILMNTEKQYYETFLASYPEVSRYTTLEVHHVSQEEFDHGGTRHEGMEYSKADVCVCMTQDAVPYDEHLLEELLKPLEDERVAVSYARQLPRAEAGPLEVYTRSFNYPETSRKKSKKDIETMGIKAFFCSDVCAAYNRETYMKLGGFIRHTIFNEDMIYASKALQHDYDVYYAAEAKVIHSHEYGFMQQLRRNFDLAVSQAEHPEVFGMVSSEKEGKKMVISACKYFWKIGRPLEIIHLIMQSGAKYIGYFLGKRYQKLPDRVVQKLTMSKTYWKVHAKE